MKKLYYIVHESGIGVSEFDVSNIESSSISMTRDKSCWLKFSEEEVKRVIKLLDFDVMEAS